jgi:hypothetical protein
MLYERGNITVVPNSLDYSDTLKFGTLGAEIVCGIWAHIARQPIIHDK